MTDCPEEWDKVSLADASAWLWDQLDVGVECPCCLMEVKGEQ